MSKVIRVGIFLWIISCICHFANAQTVLYLEQMTEVKAMKFYEGQTIQIKSKIDPEWHKVKMEEIREKEKIIIYEGGMIELEDITHLRMERGAIVVLSAALKTSATSVAVIGTLSQFTDNPPRMLGVLGFSGGAYLLSRLIDRLFRYKVYRINRKNRLRIIDLSLPAPKDIYRS